MTRQHIERAILDNLTEFRGDPMAASQLQIHDIVADATNYVAERLESDYGVAPINIVANQPTYAAPTSVSIGQAILDRKVALSFYDANGARHTLVPVKPETMDSRSPNWRDTPAADVPQNYVVLGRSQFALWPVPNFSAVATTTGGPTGGPTGMWMEGSILPGLSWNSPTAECPLPTAYHDVVVLYGTYRRSLMSKDAGTRTQGQKFLQMFEARICELHTRAMRDNFASRMPAYADEYTGWWTGGLGATAIIDPALNL